MPLNPKQITSLDLGAHSDGSGLYLMVEKNAAGEIVRKCLEVENKFKLCRLHDGQVGRLLTLQNPARVNANLAEHIGSPPSAAYSRCP